MNNDFEKSNVKDKFNAQIQILFQTTNQQWELQSSTFKNDFEIQDSKLKSISINLDTLWSCSFWGVGGMRL